ncbi:TPA: putative aminohydrolase SsnA [Klebsiella michiganensis]
MSVLILKNATAAQIYPAKVWENVDIAIENDKILAVGPGLCQRYPQAQVKEMRGQLVMPGMVCSHNHFYSGLSRGIQANIAPSPDFISTLKNLWWRLDRALDEESLYYSGLICAMEAVRSGCTAVVDHHASPHYIAGSLSQLRNAFLKIGLRGMTCFETTDRNFGSRELRDSVEENIRFAREIDAAREKGDQPYLVEAHIGAHAPFTVPDEGLAMLREALKATGRGLHIHAAEDRYDVSHSHHLYGKDLLVRLAEFDLINSRTLIAHGLYISDADVELLNAQDGFLVHNARSNMNNHVGYNPRLPQMRNLALGTDGIGSDMFEEMKFAFFKHRDAGGPLWPDSFAKALSNGNELLNRNFSARFGRLEAGYKADLTICDYMAPTPLIAENIAGHIAFGLGANSVRSVMVNGVMIYEDRQFSFDCGPIFREAQKVAKKMWARMDALPA